MNVFETLKQAASVEPVAEKNGMKIVAMEDAVLMAQAQILDGEEDPGIRTMNPDGSLARSRVTVAAIDVDTYYNNRYRVIEEDGKKKAQVVVDKRAIKDQSTGRIYTARVTAYQFYREKGKLRLDKILTVSDSDFIAEFIQRAGRKDMVEILPLLEKAEHDITVTSIDI